MAQVRRTRKGNVSVSLSAPLSRYVREQVKSGRFPSADAVVSAALKAQRAVSDLPVETDEEIRKSIREVRREVAQGRTYDAATVIAAVRASIRRKGPRRKRVA